MKVGIQPNYRPWAGCPWKALWEDLENTPRRSGRSAELYLRIFKTTTKTTTVAQKLRAARYQVANNFFIFCGAERGT
jgi:hypothetical protein